MYLCTFVYIIAGQSDSATTDTAAKSYHHGGEQDTVGDGLRGWEGLSSSYYYDGRRSVREAVY